TYGGDGNEFGYSVKQTQDGGFIIVGYTTSFGNGGNDIYLIKTDSQGDTIWVKTFGGSENDGGRSIQQTSDGGFIITGYTSSFGNGQYDLYLIKTDGNGNEQWSQTFGGIENDYGYSIQQTSDGGFIITGNTSSFGNGESDVYLIKTDGNGNEQWSQTFGGIENDYGYSIQQTSDGGFIITGVYNSTQNDNGTTFSDLWLLKTDENGIEQWNQKFEGDCSGFVGNSVEQTQDGGYIISGTDFTSSVFGSSCSYNTLIKTDGSGIKQWIQNVNYNDQGQFISSGNSVKQTTDGGYIITGYISEHNPNNSWDISVIKTDSQGDTLWTKTFGGTSYDEGFSVQQIQDGGYIIGGYTRSFGNGESDIYLIKTDGQGNISSTTEIPLPNPNRKLEKTVNIKGQEIKPQTNQPIIEIFDDGTVEKKIVVE
ncbi:MAG: hypothetical protein ACON5E_07825, partial [Flavobacteriales bacterium]